MYYKKDEKRLIRGIPTQKLKFNPKFFKDSKIYFDVKKTSFSITCLKIQKTSTFIFSHIIKCNFKKRIDLLKRENKLHQLYVRRLL